MKTSAVVAIWLLLPSLTTSLPLPSPITRLPGTDFTLAVLLSTSVPAFTPVVPA